MIIVMKLTTLVVITSWYFIQKWSSDKSINLQKITDKAIITIEEVIRLAGRPQKYHTLEEIRAAQREQSNRWYNKPENKEKRKASMRDYYRRKKAEKANEAKAND